MGWDVVRTEGCLREIALSNNAFVAYSSIRGGRKHALVS